MESRVDNKALRSFGLLVGGIFVILGLWPSAFRGGDVRLWALGLGFGLILPGLVLPRILRGPYRVWMRVGHHLGRINSWIILTFAYYAIFTPVGVIRRSKHDPMHRKFDREAASYRVERESRNPSHLSRQF